MNWNGFERQLCFFSLLWLFLCLLPFFLFSLLLCPSMLLSLFIFFFRFFLLFSVLSVFGYLHSFFIFFLSHSLIFSFYLTPFLLFSFLFSLLLCWSLFLLSIFLSPIPFSSFFPLQYHSLFSVLRFLPSFTFLSFFCLPVPFPHVLCLFFIPAIYLFPLLSCLLFFPFYFPLRFSSCFIAFSCHLFPSTRSLPHCCITFYLCQCIEMHERKRPSCGKLNKTRCSLWLLWRANILVSWTPERGAHTCEQMWPVYNSLSVHQSITFTWPHTSRLEFIWWNGFHVCIIVNKGASEYSALFDDAKSTVETM